jgi:ABC-type transporter Mla subunit MlaD
MKEERNALKAGIFILVSLGLIVGILVSIEGLDRLIEPRQVRKVVFDLADNIGGLRVGDEVRIGGYQVGQVREIRVEEVAVDDEARPSIVVVYAMPRRYTIREDAQIAVETTVTGMSVLNFQSLGRGSALPEDRPLRGDPSAMQLIYNNLVELGPQVQAVVRDVRQQTLPRVNQAIDKFAQTADTFTETGRKTTELVAKVEGKVDPAMEEYETFTQAATEMMVHLRDIFGDIKGDVRELFANLRGASGTVNERLPDLSDQLAGLMEKLTQTVDEMSASMDGVRQAVSNTQDLTATARSVIVSNRTKLDGMIDSLKQTSDNLRLASAEIRRSPWRLLYRPRPGEVENLHLFDAARHFAEGAGDLHDAAGALRDALNDPQTDPQRLEDLMRRVERSFDNFRHVEGKLWESVRE